MRLLLALAAISLFSGHPPRTWSQPAVDSLELPLANPAYSPRHIGEKEYYQIPERVLYKTYPVYAPGREPAGYMEWLKTREPQILSPREGPKNLSDWRKEGKLVFFAPTSYNPVFFSAANLRDPKFFKAAGIPVASDGVVPFASWVIRKKGTVELGSMGCNTCHTRVLPDGTVVPGAQGNNPNDREGAMLMRASMHAIGSEKTLARVRLFARQFEAPWLPNDINRLSQELPLASLIAAGEAIPPGVTARANTSIFLPPQIPDLIGVRDRRYLDHTGLIRQRDIGDLMRYTSLSQDLFSADTYGPVPATNKLPRVRSPMARYSDQQLYALAIYLYSLRPPPNPNRFNPSAARGKALFRKEKCGVCHTPPLYTNNKLLAADGFRASGNVKAFADVMPMRIGTDARYTLDTRKGTGYYKVPSLKGVWYRGPFGHNGSAATLEEWFDPNRLRSDYVPRGYKGYDGLTRGIPGHPFGLNLSPTERADLLAFLRTL